MTENKRFTHCSCEYYNKGVCLAYWNVYGNAWSIDKYNYCLGDLND